MKESTIEDSHPHGRGLSHPPLPVHRYTSDGTTWLADSGTLLPSVVVGDGTEGYPVDYLNTTERLLFIADPAGDLPNKFEAFSPTLFRPRGSCITDFPRAGEYRIAVWSDDTLLGQKRFSVGLGLAERDVFSPRSLVFFDYTLMRIHQWNGWSAGVLLLPIILAVVLLVAALKLISIKAPKHFGTTSGWPTPFRLMVSLGGTIILGHVIINIAILLWAVGNSHAGNEYMFALITSIILPVLNGLATLLLGLRLGNPCCCCCCPGPIAARAHPGHRLFLVVPGLLHIMLHAGYIVGPALLLVAAILPPSLANVGLAADSVPHMLSASKVGHDQAKKAATQTSAVSVAPTPATPAFTSV